MDLLRPHRKEPSQPQLTAMIDVFSMLIIFLISGTVFGSSSILLPRGILLPLSSAQRELAAAPQATISSQGVSTSFTDDIVPLSAFRPENRSGGRPDGGAAIEPLRAAIRAFVRERGGAYLNVVADRGLAYRDLYDAIEVFREDGFEALNFVSEPLPAAVKESQ
jgi:biopolymer transport protein ExbD